MRTKKYLMLHVGKKFKTNEGQIAIIVDGGSRKSYVKIKIDDWTKEVQMSALKQGIVKNPYYPSVRRLGFMGEGQYTRKNTHLYDEWRYQLSPDAPEWHNFQKYAKEHV